MFPTIAFPPLILITEPLRRLLWALLITFAPAEPPDVADVPAPVAEYRVDIREVLW